MTISSNRNAWLLAAALVLGATSAHAEPSAADLATARTFFKQGETLRANGDFKGALEPLRRAHELAHTPITGVELGTVYEQLGMLIEARDVWREVSSMPSLPDESASTRRARADVAARRGPLEARIPAVRIDIQGAMTAVTIDGNPVPLTSLKERISLDPGPHAIVVTDGKTSRTVRVDLGEGVESHVALDLSAPAPPVIVVVPAAPTTKPAPPNRTLFWTGLGVAGVGLVVGGVTGALALSKKGDVANACDGTICPPSAQSDIDASKSFGTISTIAFAVAGVGAAVALVSFLVIHPDPGARTAFTMRGLEGSF